MRNRARVLIKQRQVKRPFGPVMTYTYECSECGLPEGLEDPWDASYIDRWVAYRDASDHARHCPALHLARLREQITAAVAEINRLRTILWLRHYSTLANVALTEALTIITEHTGITP